MKHHINIPEERPRTHYDAAVIILTASGLLSLVLFLFMHDLTHPPLLPAVPGQTWLERDPVQCRGNPWEQDWQNVRANLTGACQGLCSQLDAPQCTTSCLVTAYYQSLGISIHSFASLDFKTKFGEPVQVCQACSCPAGYTIYVRIEDEDVARLQGLGFRDVSQNCSDLPPAERSYGCK